MRKFRDNLVNYHSHGGQMTHLVTLISFSLPACGAFYSRFVYYLGSRKKSFRRLTVGDRLSSELSFMSTYEGKARTRKKDFN